MHGTAMATKSTPIRRFNKKRSEPFFKRAKAFAAARGKVMLVAAALPAAALGGYAGYRQVMTSQYLVITEIAVGGTVRLSKEEIIVESGIKAGENIFSFSASDAVKALKENPWVKEARIGRTGLDAVSIEISERVPLALVRFERPGMPDRLRIMDAQGDVFAEYTHEDALDLPVVTGITEGWRERDGVWTAPAVLELIQFLKNRQGFNIEDVSEIHLDKTFGISVYTLNEGVRLDVGNGGFEEKFASFDKIIVSRGGTLRGIEAMNLNDPREVVVKFTTNMV